MLEKICGDLDMQPKWRAPACYVGVALICALYLLIVPGVLLTDVAAGAGIGAALMWAINEWEAGKWKVVAVAQPALAGAGAAAIEAQAVLNQAAPAQAAQPAPAQTVSQVTVAQATLVEQAPAAEAPRPARVDAGAATPATMEKWEIDEKEPSWDPSALAETWAKLRRELSINGSARPKIAPDLPRTAQLAKGPLFSRAQTPVTKPAPAAAPAPVAAQQPVAKPPLLAQQARLAAAHPKTTSSYSPMASQQLGAGTLRKTASGSPEPQRTAQAQPQSSFMRPSPSRPR